MEHRCTIDTLIDTAEEFEGIKFVTLENVLRWKKLMGRPKDLEHIKMIKAYLVKKTSSKSTASM